MGLYDFTFYDLINRNASTYGNKTAWVEVDDDRRLTFTAYKEKADRLACGLQKSGVQKGDRIGVVGKNSLEFFLLYGAAAALGAIVLPINWRLSVEEMVYNLNDGMPKILFADKEFQEGIQGARKELSTVEAYFDLGPAGGDFSDFSSLLEKGETPDLVDVATDEGFVIIHTAAVAGRPRGALLSHGNVLCADMHLDYHCQVTSDDVHLNILPLFHVGGLFMATATFHVGATNLNVRKFDAEKAVSLIAEKGASILIEFPPILSSILEAHEKTGTDISGLRAVAGLESSETIEKYQELTGGTFYVLYGQTETSCLATFGAYNDQPGSAGRPLPLADVRLVDAYDREVPVGQVGEIIVKGPMVFKGYWNLPEDNAYAFREGWHHTGDQGRFDEEGFLWYAGRMAEKELIKPGGENVYPAEVEKVILEHPKIEATVVIGVPDPKWKEGIKAVCKLMEGETLSPRELIDFVGERIARYKKPQYVEFVADLPFLEDGSPDRVKVKELYGDEQ
ncbi:MAG: AMP-binding protein [Deltaproteobacteria bacterium]|nr:AMP-binding protein [Deltaproteobacteria bacterium]